MGASRASLSRVIKVSIFFMLRILLFKNLCMFLQRNPEIEDLELLNCTPQITVLILYISKRICIKIKHTRDCQTVKKLNAKLMGKARCFRSFKSPPKPSEAKLEEGSREFYHGIFSAMRAKSLSPVYVKMDLDLWRYASFNRGAESQHGGYWPYQIEDFS